MESQGTESGALSRRWFALPAGGSLAFGLAGCVGNGSIGEGSEVTDGPVIVASFFTFYDFTREIADETPVSVENLVLTGLHGHGWEPDPSITRDIIDADAFVNVGPDFQQWADRAIQPVRDDGADTHLINVHEGIELLNLADTVGKDKEVGTGEDPHFWLDLGLAKQSVDNIAVRLGEIALFHESAFAENADAVKTELEAVDSEWESIFEEDEREVAFFAAHNAFEYIGRRYGATIQPLVTNLAANDDVRPADMRRAQDTIAENDIRHLGAGVFEPRRPARQLPDETDVEAFYPVTPYAGITEAWDDRG